MNVDDLFFKSKHKSYKSRDRRTTVALIFKFGYTKQTGHCCCHLLLNKVCVWLKALKCIQCFLIILWT